MNKIFKLNLQINKLTQQLKVWKLIAATSMLGIFVLLWLGIFTLLHTS